jgi:hypothetical protein
LKVVDFRRRLAGALVASAICAGCGGGSSPTDPNALSVLERAPEPKDRLAPALRQALAGPGLVRDSGGRIEAARQTAPGVWAIPAGATVCAAIDFPRVAVAQTCGPKAKIGDALFALGRLRKARGPVVAGLVGDGVSRISIRLANGRTSIVPVTDNGFRSPPLPSRPVSMSFTGPTGVHRQSVVRAPAP